VLVLSEAVLVLVIEIVWAQRVPSFGKKQFNVQSKDIQYIRRIDKNGQMTLLFRVEAQSAVPLQSFEF